MTARVHFPIQDGVVLIGGDLHAWPGADYPAYEYFVTAAAKLKPKLIILNGDVIHGAKISKHARIGWEKQPLVIEELEEATILLAMLEAAAPRAEKIWTLGNHDARFETRIANQLPEYERVPGLHLKDHFPKWKPAWAVHIGGPEGLIVKHRLLGGQGAQKRNALKAGMSIVTGHTHHGGIEPVTTYSGTIFGCEHGLLANPNGPQFNDWMEENPRDWQMGYIVATFVGGRVLMPEFVHVRLDGRAEFRGREL